MLMIEKIWKRLQMVASQSQVPNQECVIYLGHSEYKQLMSEKSVSSISIKDKTCFGHQYFRVDEESYFEIYVKQTIETLNSIKVQQKIARYKDKSSDELYELQDRFRLEEKQLDLIAVSYILMER